MVRTERLTLRLMTHDEVDLFVAYQSEPETLRWLGSQIAPDPNEIHAQVESAASEPWPGDGIWRRLAIDLDGEMIGNVVSQVRPGGGIAEVGYALRPEFRGHGYAAEATSAVVDTLIAEHGIHRVEASLSPENVASMRVLESIGMTFEVLARDAYNLDGVWEDDLRYAMTVADRRAWVERDRRPPARVDLVEITADDAAEWSKLSTHHSQQRLVATMASSFRDALFPELVDGVATVPWMRGISADGERAGFLMASSTYGLDDGWYLWRLLIDRMHQRRGIGDRALRQFSERLRTHGVPRLYTSCVEGIAGTPRPFYDRLGFVATGRIVDDETELVLELVQEASE